jgi:uncharacterized membrane protein
MGTDKEMDSGVAGVFKTPKTILGFFAIILAILFLASIWIVRILASDPTLHYLIVPILVFLAAILLLVLIGVFITAWKDPTILMLGQVTGEVYLQYRQLKLGDSSQGETIEDVTVKGQTVAMEIRQLPPSKEEER